MPPNVIEGQAHRRISPITGEMGVGQSFASDLIGIPGRGSYPGLSMARTAVILHLRSGAEMGQLSPTTDHLLARVRVEASSPRQSL